MDNIYLRCILSMIGHSCSSSSEGVMIDFESMLQGIFVVACSQTQTAAQIAPSHSNLWHVQ